MYAREAKGQTLTFQVSGMLWKRSLVMRDIETGSLWSHLLGVEKLGVDDNFFNLGAHSLIATRAIAVIPICSAIATNDRAHLRKLTQSR